MKKIQIKREKGYYGMVRTLNIIVDGNKLGALKQGESITLDLPTEAKEIWGKMDWATTERLPIESMLPNNTLIFQGYFTLNPLKNLGITKMPVKVFQQPNNLG